MLIGRCSSQISGHRKLKKVTASERTRISYFTAPSAATYTALSKESRMKSTEATVLDRKSRGSRGICGAPRLPHKGLSALCTARRDLVPWGSAYVNHGPLGGIFDGTAQDFVGHWGGIAFAQKYKPQ